MISYTLVDYELGVKYEKSTLLFTDRSAGVNCYWWIDIWSYSSK